MNIAVYGLGRIGRLFFRLCHGSKTKNFTIKLLADKMPLPMVTHLIKYDSTHGKISEDFDLTSDSDIKYVQCSEPNELPYKELGIDYVIDASGKGISRDWAQKHIDSGARKVIISTLLLDADYVNIFGINHTKISPKAKIISNASCTSNCVVPIVNILEKEYGVVAGNICSIHAYTNGQNILDGIHEDIYRSRAVYSSIIPSKTNASFAIDLLFPSLKNKINCYALRVPVANVSALECNFILQKTTSVENVNSAFKSYAKGSLKTILNVNQLPLVSIDYNTSTYSCIIDSNFTSVTHKNFCKVFAWYNNELAYASRLFDLVNFLSQKGF